MSTLWEGVWGEGVCVWGGGRNKNARRPSCHINFHMQKVLGRSCTNSCCVNLVKEADSKALPVLGTGSGRWGVGDNLIS